MEQSGPVSTGTSSGPSLGAGGGECGALVRAYDWGTSPLGPIEHWPVPLRTAADICLESRYGMCVFWGPEHVAIYNDAYVPMLGAKHPRAVGMRLQDIWPELWDLLEPMLAGVAATGEATWHEDQPLRLERNGFVEEGYFTYSFSPIRDESGAVAGIFTAVHETTDRVLGTRRLEALARLGDELASAQTETDVVIGAIGALARAAEDVELAALYLVGEDGGTRFAGACRTEDRWAEAAAAAASGRGELELEDPQVVALPVDRPGSPVPAAALVLAPSALHPFDDRYHEFFRMIARQLSGALTSAAALASAQRRADELATLDRAKTEFFANVSHEFRTPLTLMLAPLGDALIDTNPDRAVQHERIELAQRGALRLLRLVNALLDLSRIEAGRAAPIYAPVDLGRLVRDAVATFQAAIDRSGLELVVDVPEEGTTIQADAAMLEKILLNLLSNAYKFTLEGRIEVRVRVGESALIEVVDTGVGIPADELPRLFERFHRVEGARGRSFEGSGIGLALARDLALLHSGEITVTSVEGEGSTFLLELPLAHPEASARAAAEAASLQDGDQRAGFAREAEQWGDDERTIVLPPTPGAPEVLVVDDNADLRIYLARLLEPEYAVRTAVDGADALEQIAERPPDLVLTDVMMPRVDGFELLAKLRESPRTRRMPVIVLSARAGEEATVEGLDAGADDYLVKPFSGPELLARVHANLEVTRLRDALATGERERAREMEDVALTLQRSLLPRALPDVLGAELCGRYVPASESLEIGGDFYDATALGDGRLVITIGDVAGHGVLAAAVMGQVRQAVRAYAFEGHAPAGLMDRLDLLVSDSGLAMTTCLCGILDPGTGILRFANAGHPPPLVRRADGAIERITSGLSHPLGVTMAHRHTEAEVVLELGEALLLYTDGLVERRGEVIDIGIDRLADRFALGFTSAEEACERIVEELGQDLADDAALLAVTRTPMAGEHLHTTIPAHPDRLAEVRRRLSAWLSAHGASRGEANDVVLATHEAAMNAIEHAYGPADAEISVSAVVYEDGVEITVHDSGRWREARSEHRGRGRSIMSALMDDVSVDTGPTGSTVRLRRRLEKPGAE
jgi:signal transduction histidine kinase/serine phosphatase RsbU (regulator of sigma subunit)/anti-sigma regulatory factor (Ser/Thr protein kinase)